MLKSPEQGKSPHRPPDDSATDQLPFPRNGLRHRMKRPAWAHRQRTRAISGWRVVSRDQDGSPAICLLFLTGRVYPPRSPAKASSPLPLSGGAQRRTKSAEILSVTVSLPSAGPAAKSNRNPKNVNSLGTISMSITRIATIWGCARATEGIPNDGSPPVSPGNFKEHERTWGRGLFHNRV